ncbi:MAG: F0F1 ATP synthase subunit B [Bifidobacteriaceae bacterium]|jgi:F-type H+-transporting ATPase subunit b|nr:F0F1 ATP synthase subunit B [Bifidobacteriaceae bacterium]
MILASGAPEGAGLFIPPLHEIVISAVIFAVVAWVVAKKAVPAFLRTLDERTAKIAGGLRQAEEAEERIALERQQWRAELEQERNTIAGLLEQARADAASIVADAQNQARQEAERIIAAAQSQVAAETKKAEETLRLQVGGLATSLAGQIIGEALADQALADRVIDRFLDDLANSLEQETAQPAHRPGLR